jgi:hypothetical protein
MITLECFGEAAIAGRHPSLPPAILTRRKRPENRCQTLGLTPMARPLYSAGFATSAR